MVRDFIFYHSIPGMCCLASTSAVIERGQFLNLPQRAQSIKRFAGLLADPLGIVSGLELAKILSPLPFRNITVLRKRQLLKFLVIGFHIIILFSWLLSID